MQQQQEVHLPVLQQLQLLQAVGAAPVEEVL
jgi:hypothetical protein